MYIRNRIGESASPCGVTIVVLNFSPISCPILICNLVSVRRYVIILISSSVHRLHSSSIAISFLCPDNQKLWIDLCPKYVFVPDNAHSLHEAIALSIPTPSCSALLDMHAATSTFSMIRRNTSVEKTFRIVARKTDDLVFDATRFFSGLVKGYKYPSFISDIASCC